MMNANLRGTAALAAVLAMIGASHAVAQTAAPTSKDADGASRAPSPGQGTPTSDPGGATVTSPVAVEPGGGAEIVITGTRRSTTLQRAPISVTALSSERLASANFTQASDIQYLAPSVAFNPVVGAGFNVRGFGTQGFDYNLEKTVAVVVDDVVQGLPRSLGFNKLTDIERIEVLDGPQGTLFGKNASAGAIFVVTRKPVIGEVSNAGNIRYGTDNEFGVEHTLNVPIASNVAARVNGVYQRRDGYLTNRFNGYKGGGFRDYNVRAKLLWKPTPDLEVYLVGEVQDQRNYGNGVIETIRSYNAPASIPPGSAGLLDYNSLLGPYGIRYGARNEDYVHDRKVYANTHQSGLQGNITYGIGDYTLTSITAYKKLSFDISNDSDNTATQFLSINLSEMTGHQFSQEVRLNSPAGKLVDYVIGAYLWDQNVLGKELQGGTRGQTNLPQTTPPTFYGLCCAVAAYPASQNSIAAFGQANVHLLKQLTLILGGRYTHDRSRAGYYPTTDPRFTFVGLGAAPFPVRAAAGQIRASDFSGRIGLQYQATRDVMVYGSYTQGYKGPAVGTVRGVPSPVTNESVDSYEAGIKTQFLDRRLTFNLVGFYEKFRDFQTQAVQFNGDGTTSFLLTNAPAVIAKGVQVDASARPSRDLSLFANLAYNPTEYRNFQVPCYTGQPITTGGGPGCRRVGTGSVTVNDVSGLPSLYAPRWTYNLGFDYSPALNGDVRLITNASYNHRSKQYSGVGDPNTIIDGYGLFNANIGVSRIDASMKLTFFTRNLFDTHFVSRIRPLGFAPGGSYTQTPALDARRTIGIRLDYSF